MTKVLVIEDDPVIADGLRQALEEKSFAVTTAHDGAKGYTIANKKNFDLILLDVELPGKNGFDICRELRRHGYESGIIMLTGRKQDEDKIRGFDIGADDYCTNVLNLSASGNYRQRGRCGRSRTTTIS